MAKLYRITVDGTHFPDIDVDDLELGEKRILVRMAEAEFDTETGEINSVNPVGFTQALIYLAWRRVDPRAATEARVGRLRDSQYEILEVDADPPAEPPAPEEPAEVVTLEPTGRRSTPESTEYAHGSSSG